eukprot:scaffold297_cov108-Isochrysis_galbana.AAC.21
MKLMSDEGIGQRCSEATTTNEPIPDDDIVCGASRLSARRVPGPAYALYFVRLQRGCPGCGRCRRLAACYSILCAVPGTVKTSARAGCGCGLWAVTRLQLSRWLTQRDLEVLCAVVGLTPGLGLGA